MQRAVAVFGMLTLLLPVLAFAAEVEDAPLKNGKRFFPIDASRSGRTETQQGVAVVREKAPFVLRKDKDQIASGFMRIDRARSTAVSPRTSSPLLVTTPHDSATPVTVAPTTYSTPSNDDPADDTESEEIIGNREAINPVLALFDDGEEPVLGSFSDVMLGKTNRSGTGRHAFWPIPLNVKQRLTSGYGMRNDPFHGRQSFHGGIDIAADEGTPVLATADATVAEVANDPRYGKYVTLAHADGTLSRYGHLSGQSVREGQRVKGGQAIGAVGTTGRSTGAHLDYRVSRNNTKFDPLSLLRVPSTVAYNAPRASQAAAKEPAIFRGNKVASNALPKRPMVIRVQ